MKKEISALVAALLIGVAVGPVWADYSKHFMAEGFADRMKKEGFTEQETMALLRLAEPNTDVLKLIARPAERMLPWHKYKTIYLNDGLTQSGVQFARTYAEHLQRAETEFGVPASIILGILGVETRYGERLGDYTVLNSLATLAFDYRPRGEFFRNELASYLLMVREEGLEPTKLRGSYVGAFGMGQFLPSSFRAYAVDFDGDGKRDIINSIPDAIGSVGNYLKERGWQSGEEIAVPAVMISESNQLRPVHTIRQIGWLGLIPERPVSPEKRGRAIALETGSRPEFWIGLNNFWILTQFNRLEMYGMVVYQLGQSVTAVIEREQALDRTAAELAEPQLGGASGGGQVPVQQEPQSSR
ncbi:MAG: lytic murein transglycosylase B [Gammaproteobacteria bacterium AqS3]|nr:lytic murein transglycosylase B [Gammaproteobacteria bacterium AqS3]